MVYKCRLYPTKNDSFKECSFEYLKEKHKRILEDLLKRVNHTKLPHSKK